MNKDLKIKIILANFLTFILRRIWSELQQGAEFEGEGADVGAAGEVVLIGGDVGGEGSSRSLAGSAGVVFSLLYFESIFRPDWDAAALPAFGDRFEPSFVAGHFQFDLVFLSGLGFESGMPEQDLP